ncbi:hypothetical protein MDOR_09220 [Mycolicibacterium doricum]|uniref:ADP-ribosyltransferse n=1 Tax=Mycolicibacterium doricum TaxID=126673 RepID=A0A1X1TBR2_9MYCO|nr:hypothetical protein [Mycolicibacterium doricum]ORV42014.1 hypothetical protein AWC01_08995 [Mycolicibacterium doricum]BBZ06753.1 hypothetical protein MDOR_09220 [Mycolicibacterium doricum]
MGAVGAGTRIEVEPDALVGAGKHLGSFGTQLGMLSDALGSVVSGGIASGTDPAGLDFGLKYGDQAQEFATGLADAANAFKSVGFMLEGTGHNYKNADAASTVGGSGLTGGVGSPPGETQAADAATGPDSNTVSPPSKWHLIVPFLNVIPGGMFAGAALTWPSGNSGMMRLTAAQWRNLGQGLSIFDDAVAPVKALVAAQQIQEGGKIDEVLGTLSQAVSGLSTNASALAQLIDDFAGGVQETQDAIRRLLDRISLDGAWDMVKGIFTGEADDILREVARDVGTVLENFQQQVKGVVGLLGELTSALGDAVTALQNWVRPRLEELLGDDVGGALANAFTMYTDFQVGLTTGLINTVAGTVAMADPDTWKGMAETVMSVAEDPSKLPGVLADMGAEFVALDKWSSDHPGRAAGEAAFNIGSLFVPGGALSKTGTLAKGLSATRGLLHNGRIPGLRGLGSGSGTPGVDVAPDLDSVGAGLPGPPARPPAIPESLLNPTSPNGGDGPPPGPPATPTGPTESGPGRADGPPPQSPATPGPGSVDTPSDAPSTPSPSDPWAPTYAPAAAGDQAPPAAQHSPGASSPAGSGDVPSGPSHAPSTSDARTQESNQIPEGTTHFDGGTAPSPGGHAGDAPGHGSSNTTESNAHSDARPPAAHSPAAENHGTHERTTDTTRPAQQPYTSSDGNPVRQESGNGSAPPERMAGIAPMVPHAPGATHSPGVTHSADAPARTPEGRTPEPRAAQAMSPENSRPQSPSASGPTAENAPTRKPFDANEGNTPSADGNEADPATWASTKPPSSGPDGAASSPTGGPDSALGHGHSSGHGSDVGGFGSRHNGVGGNEPIETGTHRSADTQSPPGTADQPTSTIENSVESGPTGDSHARNELPELTDEKRAELLAMEKGTRPDPSEYLSPEYIHDHLEKFREGATRFMPETNFEKYGLAQRDGTSFVMAKSEVDAMLVATKDDPRAMERVLGWPEGFLSQHKLLRIDIPDPYDHNLRIPSGNEAGANDLWLPEGQLPDGNSEAVIDGDRITPDDYTITEITE